MPKTVKSLIVGLLAGAAALGVVGGVLAESSGQPLRAGVAATTDPAGDSPSPGDMTWG
jgi:hypothetical protein